MSKSATYQPVDDVLARAAELGAASGKNAAAWCTDGNPTNATYLVILAGIVDGDPAVLDAFRVPDLFGEWADKATPATLARELGYDVGDDGDDGDTIAWQEIESDVCEAWETAAQDAFWAELERVCRFHVTR